MYIRRVFKNGMGKRLMIVLELFVKEFEVKSVSSDMFYKLFCQTKIDLKLFGVRVIFI